MVNLLKYMGQYQDYLGISLDQLDVKGFSELILVRYMNKCTQNLHLKFSSTKSFKIR